MHTYMVYVYTGSWRYVGTQIHTLTLIDTVMSFMKLQRLQPFATVCIAYPQLSCTQLAVVVIVVLLSLRVWFCSLVPTLLHFTPLTPFQTPQHFTPFSLSSFYHYLSISRFHYLGFAAIFLCLATLLQICEICAPSIPWLNSFCVRIWSANRYPFSFAFASHCSTLLRFWHSIATLVQPKLKVDVF